MKIAVGFLYMLWMVIYLSPIIPGTNLWFGIDKTVQTLFLGMLCYFLENSKGHSYEERLFFNYLKWISWANALYLAICLWKDLTFKIYNTPIFAYVMGIGFIAFLIHCAKNKS